MSFGKAIGTVLLCALLLFSSAVMLVSGLLTFVVMNPNYYKLMVPNRAYCEELRSRIGDNLDHIAIQYGLEEGELNGVVTDADIRAYTAALVDALFSEQTTDSLTMPAYPAEGFAAYLKQHTAYSDQAIQDFSEDCAESVGGDLAALDVDLIVSGFARFRTSRLAQLAPILMIASTALTGILIAMTCAVLSEERRARGITVWGGLLLGTATVFVPLSQLWLFDFVGRLNIEISAFRTILTGLLNSALYGCIAVLGALLAFSLVMLIFACLRKPHKKRRSRAR